MAGYSANVWEDIELRIDLDPFCTLYLISSMNEKARSENQLKPKLPFKFFLPDIFPSIAPNVLASETTFSNDLLIFGVHFKITKLYGTEKITTEEVMDKIDMFQSRFGK